MRKFFMKKEPSLLDRALEETFSDYLSHEASSEEAHNSANNAATLAKIKSDLEIKKDNSVTVAVVGGIFSLLGIILVTSHEKTSVIATKALGFIQKPRV